MRSVRNTAALSLALFALALGSCRTGGPMLYPASGKVLFNGQPPVGATVVFIPNGAGPKPSGLVGDDGRYQLSTYPHGPGAPAGDYAVVVTLYPPDARGQDNPKNQLPAKYADPATSGLTRTVKAGANELELIELAGAPGQSGK